VVSTRRLLLSKVEKVADNPIAWQIFAARSVPMMAGSCAGLAALIGTFDAAGKSISGSYARGMPIYGAHATAEGGMAIEGQHLSNVPVRGELGWREERERRRQQFFKVRPL
jgi:hypothetical protein